MTDHSASSGQDPLRDQIQASLGPAYRLERELGGGGMSRVFVATETALGRRVVVKVLSPELAAGVSVDRFRREIQLAAQLQQANIVPLHAAGVADGLPYYTMPLVDGESLRARLSMTGALPTAEAVSVLRDVARALAYAHQRGVVHRDIKPDNVLLSGGAALVADFGIAKALSAARPWGQSPTLDSDPRHSRHSLTAIGTSIGTPAYMAPEQAAGDPSADHRADIYAFGVLAWELLAGRTPFHGRTPQKLLAAHMGERPEPIGRVRADCPPALAALVMRCLEKDPADRPQSAAEVLRALDGVGTPSGGEHQSVPAIALASRRTLARALAVYAAAFVVVALLARAAIAAIGLPDWVLPGTLVVMALGLPVLLFTGFVHHQSRVARTMAATRTPGGSPDGGGTMSRLAVRASPVVTWRRAALGGAAALTAFALLVGGYMALRALGIGPAGSLLAKGVIEEKARLLVADFRSPASDTTLGPVVSEAFRTDLAQSRSVVVVTTAAMRDVLVRMQKPAGTRVDLAAAREIATREGIKAIIDGEVLALGGKYVLSARLIATQSGDELATFKETADDQSDIIPAIDRLARALRERIGESLRNVRATPPLEQVTTSSLEALRRYAQGVRAVEVAGDFEKGQALLEEAIALDTGFAMAYRKLATELSNRQVQPERAIEMLEKAYRHSDRLSDRERYMTMGSYWMRGPRPDRAKAIAALEALLEIDPNYSPALNNIAILYSQMRDYVKAEQYIARGVEAEDRVAFRFENLANVQVNRGKFGEAKGTLDRMAAAFPGNPQTAWNQSGLAFAQGDFDRSAAIADSLLRARPSDLATRAVSSFDLASVALVRGQVAEGMRRLRAAFDARHAGGSRSAPLERENSEALAAIWFYDDAARALRTADAALARHPLDSLSPLERPYDDLARIFALAGRPDRARAMAAAWEKAHATPRLGDEFQRATIAGDIALGEKRYDDAIRAYRVADQGPCVICATALLARAYDLAGDADSAIATFERYLTTPELDRFEHDAVFYAGAHKRLGELYEARGDRDKAASHYARFVELWKEADPELQPRVQDAKQRLARLQAGGR